MAIGGGEARGRLAASLAIDLAGFTDRVAKAGAGAAELARDLRSLLEHEITAAHGRLEAFEGDVVTARFDAAGAALGCARAVLERIAERNVGAADPVVARVGIHLAEFAEEHGRLAGPEATLAMHIARIADAGGLVLTEPVHQQLQGQVALRGVFLPKRALRKIPWAPRVFAVPPTSARYLVWAAARGGYWRKAVAGGAIAAALIAVAIRGWQAYAPAHAAAIPPPAAGLAPTERLVQSFDNPQNCFQFAGGSCTVFWDNVPEAVKGRAARAVYRQDAANGYWGFGTAVMQNWSACDRIRFMLRATPPVVVRCEIVEEKEERWATDEPASPEWRAVEIPFARFAVRSDFNSGERNGRLDLGMISNFVISTTTPGTGTIWIDELTVTAGSR